MDEHDDFWDLYDDCEVNDEPVQKNHSGPTGKGGCLPVLLILLVIAVLFLKSCFSNLPGM